MSYTREAYQTAVKQLKDITRESNLPGCDSEGMTLLPGTSSGKDYPWVSQLSEITRRGCEAGLIEDIIIHGSYGDETATPFSDLDLTVRLQACTLEMESHRRQLRNWFKTQLFPLILTADPLQHHGPFLLWPRLANAYNPAILPCAAYESSWSIRGAPLTFRLIPCGTEESLYALQSTLSSLLDDERAFFRHGVSPFTIKRHLSNFFLLPPLYLQSQGIYLSKRDSILKLIDQKHPPIAEAMAVASELRDNWKPAPGWLGRLRAHSCTGGIPGGVVDQLICSSYKDRSLSSHFRQLVRPKVREACRLYQSLI